MRAMILAAGRGSRMGSLTAETPKALLTVGEHRLIEYPLLQLQKLGVNDVVINVHHHAQQIIDFLGDGHRYGCKIHYSLEPQLLGTGGGIVQALPLLGSAPFYLMSADVWSDFPLRKLPINLTGRAAHLVLVDNPSYHPQGDYDLQQGYVVKPQELLSQSNGQQSKRNYRYTYANLAVINPGLLFAKNPPLPFELSKVFERAIHLRQLTGEHYAGQWYNTGTQEDLKRLAAEFCYS